MMSLWDALRMNMMISYQELVRTFLKRVIDEQSWLLSKVTHNLNNNGFTTGLELEVKLSDVEYSAESDDE